MSERKKNDIPNLVQRLLDDVKSLQDKNEIEVKIICITGDLIQSGDNADVELPLFKNLVLSPLQKNLNISDEYVYIIAGNHEVKKGNIVDYIEKGLSSCLTTSDEISKFNNSSDNTAFDRISYFEEDFAKSYSGAPVWEKKLCRAYSSKLADDVSVGFVCCNTAWRSAGSGGSERGTMILGAKLLEEGISSIEDADVKICLMHHPLDWLIEADKTPVEKLLNSLDIVFTGHLHESDTKLITSSNGQVLVNICGKLDTSPDAYNGYTLLSIDKTINKSTFFVRQYFPSPRNHFDQALHLFSEGKFEAPLNVNNPHAVLAFEVKVAIEDNFYNFAKDYLVSNLINANSDDKFEIAFMEPTLARYSEYEKDTQLDFLTDDNDNDVLNVDYLCKSDKNILLLGKKEYGKTTILHYCSIYLLKNFNSLKKIPIIVDVLKVDYNGKNVFLRECCKYINKFCNEEHSFSQKDLKMLLDQGLCTVMFDNFEAADPCKLALINDFVKGFGTNSFIFSENEDVSARYWRDITVIPDCKYYSVHLCKLALSQIRALTNKNFNTTDSSNVVDKIMICFNNTTLPQTPFTFSLVLSLCTTNDFSTINEAIVIEQFLEFLLEKSSTQETSRSTFDFRNKEDFLMSMAFTMHERKKYYFSQHEFEEFFCAYHKSKGFTIKETKFDSLFFDKKVLISSTDIVTFRYNCFIEYYLAKKAIDDATYLDLMLMDGNCINYSDELRYYTALRRGDKSVVDRLSKTLKDFNNELEYLLDDLNSYKIGLDFSMQQDDFASRLKESRLSQEKSDRQRDTGSDYPAVKEKKFSEEEVERTEAFAKTFLLFGTCLKNSELIDISKKEENYKIFVKSLCIFLAILKKNTEEFCEKERARIKEADKTSTEEVEVLYNDVIKIALPLALQSIVLENIGTSKLKAVLETELRNVNNDFSEFFTVFLYCDLRLHGFNTILKDYCKKINDKSLLTIIFFKLQNYYKYRYFNESYDNDLANLLAEVNLKLRNSHSQKNRRVNEKTLFLNQLKTIKRFPS